MGYEQTVLAMVGCYGTDLIKESEIIFIVIIHEIQDSVLALGFRALAVLPDPVQSCREHKHCQLIFNGHLVPALLSFIKGVSILYS